MSLKKKRRPTPRRTAAPSLVALARRVSTLEGDFHSMRGNVDTLAEEVAGLTRTVKQVDARTLRGETLMLEIQGEQRRDSKLLDRIAAKLELSPEPPAPTPELAEPDLDEEDFDLPEATPTPRG